MIYLFLPVKRRCKLYFNGFVSKSSQDRLITGTEYESSFLLLCLFEINLCSFLFLHCSFSWAIRMQHGCGTSNTNATQVRHKQHECDTSATRVLHERNECDMSSTQTTRVRNEGKTLFLIMARVKRYFHTLIFTLWQVKDYKERNKFILKTTFWKCLVSMPKCV